MKLDELRKIVGAKYVISPAPIEALKDATELQMPGKADALVLPKSTSEVAAVMRYCYKNNIPMTARGGGTGLAAGAVPKGGIVLSLERMNKIRKFQPEYWNMYAEPGVTTAQVRELAQGKGLLYPPDPGAKGSHIGGNLATNAGGAHTFKYGVTGQWVSGLEVVVPPGEVITLGGPWRKDVANYDLTHLFIGSEGTLGIITGAWLKLRPAPQSSTAIAAFFDSVESGCDAAKQLFTHGIMPEAIEYLDEGAIDAAKANFPSKLPGKTNFMLLVELEGDSQQASETIKNQALDVYVPPTPVKIKELWTWRYGVSPSVVAKLGGKVSEDIVVPLEHVAEAINEVVEIGNRHDLPACSWGHLGDGNLHATFMLDWKDKSSLNKAHQAAEELFDMALRLGGSLSGEHGLGKLKNHRLREQSGPVALKLQRDIKTLFDPKNLLNPGAKLPEN